MSKGKPGEDSHVIRTCKMGAGKACCRYLAFGQDGFQCLKHSTMRDYIDERVAKNTTVAQGDNCPGNLDDLYAKAPDEVPTEQHHAHTTLH